MKLQLTKPIAFFDIESTHKDPLKARIIEIGIVKLFPDGGKDQMCMVFNPGENITDENAAIHGFTNEFVKDKPLFKDYASTIAEDLKGCDFGGFNSNQYDIPLLNEEFTRAGITFDFSEANFVDAGVLFKILAPRTLTAAVLTYLKKDHAGAHGAIADTDATIDVLEAMLDAHSDVLPLTVPELALKSNYDLKRLDLAGKFIYDGNGEVLFNFGKNKGIIAKNEPGFLRWMLGKDFSKDTLNVVMELLGGKELFTGPAVLPSTYDHATKTHGYKSDSAQQSFKRF